MNVIKMDDGILVKLEAEVRIDKLDYSQRKLG